MGQKRAVKVVWRIRIGRAGTGGQGGAKGGQRQARAKDFGRVSKWGQGASEQEAKGSTGQGSTGRQGRGVKGEGRQGTAAGKGRLMLWARNTTVLEVFKRQAACDTKEARVGKAWGQAREGNGK